LLGEFAAPTAIGRRDSGQTPQQHRIDAAAKTNAAIDLHDRDIVIELRKQFGIMINVDEICCVSGRAQCLGGDVTKVTARTGIQNRPARAWFSEPAAQPSKHAKGRKSGKGTADCSGTVLAAEKTGNFFCCMIL
jgi:hypothetical protein